MLEELEESVRGDARLSQDRRKRAACELPVERDDDRSPVGAAQLHMAATLRHVSEPGLAEGRDDPFAGDDGQCRAHAESSTVAMIVGSKLSGSAASSK